MRRRFYAGGNRITVDEGPGCIGLHGVSCTFDGTLIGKQGISVADKPVQAPAPSGGWVYGTDPVLGLSAYTRLEEGAVGIACISDGSNPATAEILSLRVTTELAAAHGPLFMFKDKPDAQSLKIQSGGPFAEIRDTTCGVSLESFRTANVMYLVNGTIAGAVANGQRNELTIDQNGRHTVIESGADASGILGGKTISLKGSAAAIRALLRSCPAAQYDVDTNCGL